MVRNVLRCHSWPPDKDEIELLLHVQLLVETHANVIRGCAALSPQSPSHIRVDIYYAINFCKYRYLSLLYRQHNEGNIKEVEIKNVVFHFS